MENAESSPAKSLHMLIWYSATWSPPNNPSTCFWLLPPALGKHHQSYLSPFAHWEDGWTSLGLAQNWKRAQEEYWCVLVDFMARLVVFASPRPPRGKEANATDLLRQCKLQWAEWSMMATMAAPPCHLAQCANGQVEENGQTSPLSLNVDPSQTCGSTQHKNGLLMGTEMRELRCALVNVSFLFSSTWHLPYLKWRVCSFLLRGFSL